MTYVVTAVPSCAQSVGESGLLTTLSIQLQNFSSTALQVVAIDQYAVGSAAIRGGRWPVPQYNSILIVPAQNATTAAPGILNTSYADVFSGATNPNASNGVSQISLAFQIVLTDGTNPFVITCGPCTVTVGCPGQGGAPFYVPAVPGQFVFNAQQLAVFAPLIH